jgi:hypothetical protein
LDDLEEGEIGVTTRSALIWVGTGGLRFLRGRRVVVSG